MNERSAIVIGTGFGGAVAACRLSQAGFQPLVLERGRRYGAEDFPALPGPERLLPEGRRLRWSDAQGLCDLQDLDEILSVQAAGYGGGSLIYANVHLRARSEVFEQAVMGKRLWPREYSRETLDRHYDLVAAMLDIAPISEHRDGPRLVKTDQLRRVAQQLGRSSAFFEPPLAVSRQDGPNAHGVQQSACRQCGACVSGCPHGAKNTLDLNYLAVAEANGAQIRTQCEVLRIVRVGERYRVYCLDHLTGQEYCEETTCLILSAGSVHSTRLLAGAQLGLRDEQSEQLRGALGLGYFPNADALGVVFDTAHPQYPSWGPTITSATAFPTQSEGPGGPAPWFMIQDGGYAEQLERMIGLCRSPLWGARNRYSVASPSVVPPSPHAPEPEAAPAQQAPALESVLDRLLQAQATGAIEAAAPAQLRAVWPGVVNTLSDTWLPAIVDYTIERSLQARIERTLGWWIGRFGRDTWLVRAATRFGRWLARQLGTKEEIGRHAGRALLGFGGMSSQQVAGHLGYSDRDAKRRMMLLAMGPDAASGVLHYDSAEQRMVADLDLYRLAPRYQDQERAMRDIAQHLGGELRVNPAWSFLDKPVTVHSQGGCRMSDEVGRGVTDPDGQVWHCPGLYVMDGASLCSSVGANPSHTIAAVAERNILGLIRRLRPDWENGQSPGAQQYRQQQKLAERWRERALRENWALQPAAPNEAVALHSEPIGLAFDECMQGFHSTPPEHLGSHDPERVNRAYRDAETRGRPHHPLRVEVRASTCDLQRFFEDETHALRLQGHVEIQLPGACAVQRFALTGYLRLMARRERRHRLSAERAKLQAEIGGSYRNRRSEPRITRFMRYRMEFRDEQGTPWTLHGRKHLKDDPGPDAWRDTTTLFVRLTRPGARGTLSAGAIHIDLAAFLRQLQSMRLVTPTHDPLPDPDPARVLWTLLSFTQFFFGSLQRIYIPELGTGLQAMLRPVWSRRL